MEITEALKKGKEENKAIRRKCWSEEVYLYHGLDNLITLSSSKDEHFTKAAVPSIELLLSKDWELSEEPYYGPYDHDRQQLKREREKKKRPGRKKKRHLTANNVKTIFNDCLYNDADRSKKSDPGSLLVEGIMNDVELHPVRLRSHGKAVIAMLKELPVEFFSEKLGGKGGMSFLRACLDNRGNLWGEQSDSEKLLILGQTSGYVQYSFPRELWPTLPGGMPYFLVMLPEE